VSNVRHFIQFAGFTVGRTVSYFSGINISDFMYNFSRTTLFAGDADGITLWA
jgi:hypothetical protein